MMPSCFYKTKKKVDPQRKHAQTKTKRNANIQYTHSHRHIHALNKHTEMKSMFIHVRIYGLSNGTKEEVF